MILIPKIVGNEPYQTPNVTATNVCSAVSAEKCS